MRIKQILKRYRDFSFYYLKTTFRRIKNYRFNKRDLLIASILLLIGVLIMSLLGHQKTKSDLSKQATAQKAYKLSANNYIQQHLKEISSQLVVLHKQLQENNNIQSDSIQQKFLKIQDQIQKLSQSSGQMILSEIRANTKQLKKQLMTIHGQLSVLEKERQHIRYLKPQDLPFHLISIDNIQLKNIVTLDYNHRTFPIEIGDYLADWKLIRADFVKQQAEFINAKKQHVVVDLNRLEEISKTKEF